MSDVIFYDEQHPKQQKSPNKFLSFNSFRAEMIVCYCGYINVISGACYVA